jgi:hypothetical protein
LSEQNNPEKMSLLTKFVDENFKRAGIIDILSSFVPLVCLVASLFVVLFLVTSTWIYIAPTQWIPGLVSILAVLVAYYSFVMASRKFVNKRLAYKEAKRLCSLPTLPDKSKETLCLLPPLVAIRQENYPVKLSDLYEVNKELFKPDKLIEHYHLN